MSVDDIAKRWRRFAREEAHAVSPLYESFALAVADHEEVLTRLGELPPPKQQPNLVLAAVRWHHGVAESAAAFCAQILTDWPAIRGTILARSTQTNEAARCAVLLPILASLQTPLALFEVGAAAGLCLYPDQYGYRCQRPDRNTIHITPASLQPPVFDVDCCANTPLPDQPPTICWRAGLDLNPLDAGDADTQAWLRTLIWPEQQTRADNLERACAIAAQHDTQIATGDLLSPLADHLSAAPADATVVVFHNAVLAYVTDETARRRFQEQVESVADVWIANEHPAVFPWLAHRARRVRQDRFLLTVNGEPRALTGPHGQSIEWL